MIEEPIYWALGWPPLGWPLPLTVIGPTVSYGDLARQRGQDTPTGATQPAEAAQGQRQPMTAAQIDKMKLYNDRGDQLGNVDHVILGKDNEPHIVIGHGGFLGLGEKQVVVPLDRTVVRGDRLVTHGVTDDQIKAMASWDSKAGNYRQLRATRQSR